MIRCLAVRRPLRENKQPRVAGKVDRPRVGSVGRLSNLRYLSIAVEEAGGWLSLSTHLLFGTIVITPLPQAFDPISNTAGRSIHVLLLAYLSPPSWYLPMHSPMPLPVE